MADDIKVSPTPIQRNPLDVATELTLRYYETYNVESKEDVQDTFLRFYVMAETASKTNYRKFIDYLPENVKAIIV